MIGAVIAGALGLGVAGLACWLHVRGRDGSGWGLLAFCLIVTSCMRSAP